MKSLLDIVAEKCTKRRLPFERRSKLSRLQDMLLESCARNLQEIFVEVDHKNNMTLKKGVKLESNIFERILAKGREIYLIMPPECIIFLLRFRDELNWQNIDLCPYSNSSVSLLKEDLTNISTNNASVKMLTYYTSDYITDAALESISSFSSNMEHLEIGKMGCTPPLTAALFAGVWRFRNGRLQRKIKMPRLRHLVLSHVNVNQLDAIDHTSFFGSLRVLKLHHYCSERGECLNSTILIDILRNCKNLVRLCFKDVHFGNKDMDIYEAISSLKNLRTLEMQYVIRKFDIWRIISNLPKLENLDLSFSNFFCNNVNFGELRLKYLGALQVHNESILRIPTEILLRNVNLSNFDDLVYVYERGYLIEHAWIYDLLKSIELFDSVDHINNLHRLENAFLKIMGRLNGLKVIVRITTRLTHSHYLSQDFWAKLIRHYMSYETFFPDIY